MTQSQHDANQITVSQRTKIQQRTQKLCPKKHIVCIGGGLASLAAAAQLLSKGYSVEIFDRLPTLGGKIGQFSSSGFRFDTGPSLVTMPHILKELFAIIDFPVERHLVKLDPICRYFFASGHRLDACHDVDQFSENIAKISPADAAALPKFLKYSQQIYKTSAPLFLDATSFSPWSVPLPTLLAAGLGVLNLDLFRTMSRSINSFFESPELRQLFCRYATYNGSSPFKTPALFNLIAHVEYGLGSYYLEGGIYRIVTELENYLIKNGAIIHRGTHVKQISLDRPPRKLRKPTAIGVEDEDCNQIKADAVLCNSDITWARRNLLGDIKASVTEPSTSAIVFLWGIRGQCPTLTHHNIFFSDSYRTEFKELFDQRTLPEDPTIYVNITSKTDHRDAPDGCENWFVLINAPAIADDDVDFSLKISRLRETIFKKLSRHGITDIEQRIEIEKVYSPTYFSESLLGYSGSLYGAASNTAKNAFIRQANKSKQINKLYFAGGTVHPGGGIPLVILSGRNAAAAIEKEVG